LAENFELTPDHFHVHVVHVAHEIMAGMAVGQAHMLDDVVNWVSFEEWES
jgi:m7GpppX diphosphatase